MRVTARLASRGPERTSTAAAPGALALHTHFTDALGAEDDLPIVREREGLLLAGDLRLDGRAALRGALRDAGREAAPGTTDASMLALAIGAWGAGAAARLIGDFAFAALETRVGRLVAARGTFGVKPLFVAETPQFVAVANDLDALLLLPGVDGTPDGQALADFLRAGAFVDPTRTARRGVRRVPAGMQWVWERTGASRAERTWDFPVPSPLRFRREEEYTEAFNALLDEAVGDRLRVREAGIMLSGGLDSPSLAVAARRAAPAVVLRALTVSNERIAPSDEREWAERVARHLGVAQDVQYSGEHQSLEHCLDPSLRTPEPVDEPDLLGWRAHAARLSAIGPVVLDGEDGDALLAPPDIFTMLRSLPWGETWRARRAYRAAHGRRAWIGARQHPALRRRRHAPYWRAPSWMRPELVREFGERVPEEDVPHPLRPIAAASFRQPIWETLFVLNDAAVSGSPLSVLLPFLDARLIGFVFAIPPVPWCQKKELLRRAMRGSLPAEVLARPKTPLAGSIEAAVERWRTAGGAEAPLASPMDHLVDVARWRAVVRDGDAEEVAAAWRVFELSRWLAQPGVR